MSLLKEKFDWVKGEMNRWQLTQQEQNWLLGGSGFTCGIDQIDSESEAAKTLEARFDAIHDMANRLATLHDEVGENEAAELRRPNQDSPFNGKSPLEFIKEGNERGDKNIVRVAERNLDFK